MLTTLIIFLISLAIFAISFILSDKVIKSIVSDKDIIIPYQREPALGTGNGIGGTFIRGIRYHLQTASCAYYNFFVVFNIPIIPLGCYLAKEDGFEYINYKRSVQKYKIIGELKWNILEVINIYLYTYSVISAIICFIVLIIKLIS